MLNKNVFWLKLFDYSHLPKQTYFRKSEGNWLLKLQEIQGLLNGMYLVLLNTLEVQSLNQQLSRNLQEMNNLILHMVE